MKRLSALNPDVRTAVAAAHDQWESSNEYYTLCIISLLMVPFMGLVGILYYLTYPAESGETIIVHRFWVWLGFSLNFLMGHTAIRRRWFSAHIRRIISQSLPGSIAAFYFSLLVGTPHEATPSSILSGILATTIAWHLILHRYRHLNVILMISSVVAEIIAAKINPAITPWLAIMIGNNLGGYFIATYLRGQFVDGLIQQEEMKIKNIEIERLNRYISESVLTRYLPPTVVESILAGRTKFEPSPKADLVTVLFVDICRFTAITNKLSPNVVAETLNKFLSDVSATIFAHQGMVDKFIGDSVMALFGVPDKQSPMAQAASALACSRAILKQVSAMNDVFHPIGIPRIEVRIGVHQGSVIMGHFGGKNRSEYTAIGSTVNLAARIQRRAAPGQILVSEEIQNNITESLVPAGNYSLRGFEGTYPLFDAQPAARAMDAA